jgi:F-box interacting protein
MVYSSFPPWTSKWWSVTLQQDRLFSYQKSVATFAQAQGLGFGFDPHSNKYKMARAFYQRDYPTTRQVCKFEVLTLGTNAWRQTEDPPYPIDRLTPVHVKGAIYWKVCRTPLCPYPPKTFLRFCLTDEKFSLFPCPPCSVKPYCFTEVEGELCCACFYSWTLELEIWTCSVG